MPSVHYVYFMWMWLMLTSVTPTFMYIVCQEVIPGGVAGSIKAISSKHRNFEVSW